MHNILEVVVVAILLTMLKAVLQLLSVVGAVLHLYMKLCADIFIKYADINIFMIFNMATNRHLGFVGGSHGTTHESPFTVAVRPVPCKIFFMIIAAILKLQVFEILSLMLKSPIHGPKISVFGV